MQAQDIARYIQDKPGESFRVHRSIYTDPAIHEAELDHIWEGNWVYVAHESEIPEAGDYLTTTVGRVPVLITRDREGQINGFVNACPHRGAKVCRKPKGQVKNIMCPYHGWVFDLQGSLLDMKDAADASYPEAWNERGYALPRVPRIDSYRGFVFVSLNAEVESLEDHLAAAKTFIDLFVDQSPQGLEVLKGRSSYTHHGNWKMQAENGVDGYHVDVVHRSYFSIAGQRARQAQAAGDTDEVHAIDVLAPESKSGNYDLGNGHVVIWFDVANWRERPLGMQYEAVEQRVGPVRAKWMAGRLRQVLIYPNVILFDGISTQIRSWRPVSADETEVTVACIAPRGEPQAARDRRLRQYEDFYGASGLATPDDLTEFDACQEGYKAADLAPWQDFDRGITRRVIGADEEARELGLEPVVSAPRAADETLYHGEYRQWLKLITKGLAREQEQQDAA